ncbi:MAG TPA: sodium:proton antiporter [Psychromonas hadalis]|nr:sodium:proton antiporter [Psychromonas hadalis]
MSVYASLCFIAFAAIMIAYINTLVGKMQTTIVITGGSLILSLIIILGGQFDLFHLDEIEREILTKIDFQHFLLQGMLGFLLFAGGLGIKLSHLSNQKWEISFLALGATLFSTFFVGYATFYACQAIGIPLDLIYCLLFGALISPTDPIAVLAIVKKLKAPEQISIQIEGESLFNDGFGLVIFATIFAVAFGGEPATISGISSLLLEEAVGGIVYGFAIGIFMHFMIKNIHDHSMELLLTFTVPTAGYALAYIMGVSGPLAMVVSGIMLGNVTLADGFSKEGGKQLHRFWELVDEFLNGVLFLLIGMVMLTFTFHWQDLSLMLISIPIVLLARYLSIKTMYIGFNRFRSYNPMSVKILTWGGLRGGLALAMALAIPSGISPSGIMELPEKGIDVREIILVMTYSVALFSILIQGSTMNGMIMKAKRLDETEKPKD